MQTKSNIPTIFLCPLEHWKQIQMMKECFKSKNWRQDTQRTHKEHLLLLHGMFSNKKEEGNIFPRVFWLCFKGNSKSQKNTWKHGKEHLFSMFEPCFLPFLSQLKPCIHQFLWTFSYGTDIPLQFIFLACKMQERERERAREREIGEE